MGDLFLSRKERLKRWGIERQLFSAADIEDQARVIGIFASTARRYVRELTEKHTFRSLRHEEKLMRGLLRKGYSEIAWYERA